MSQKSFIMLYALIIVAITQAPAYACTAFMMSDGERVLVGNNEDYTNPYTHVWFVPAENERYGRVYFGYDNWSPQGGMNDQGLFFDFFTTPGNKIKLSKNKPKFPGPMTDTMLAECASVEEVLDLFNKYNLEWMSKIQMFIVDKSGDAAIIEGDKIIRKSGSLQVVTNFLLSKVAEDRRPCQWPAWGCSQYKKAHNMLTESKVASVVHFRDILKATCRDNFIAKTLYSNIYDLKKGLVYLYYLHNFENEVIIDLNEELKKGRHYYELPSLFGRKQKFKITKFNHTTPSFSISYPEHYKVASQGLDEVLLVKHPNDSTPEMGVYVKNKPQDIPLQDLGPKYFSNLIEKYSTKAKMVYNIQTMLNDGTPGREMLFERVLNEHWPFKTLILATYKDDKLIFLAVTSFAHPEMFREFLYTLQFD